MLLRLAGLALDALLGEGVGRARPDGSGTWPGSLMADICVNVCVFVNTGKDGRMDGEGILGMRGHWKGIMEFSGHVICR